MSLQKMQEICGKHIQIYKINDGYAIVPSQFKVQFKDKKDLKIALINLKQIVALKVCDIDPVKEARKNAIMFTKLSKGRKKA